MALILNLETTTKVCSVSLALNGIEIGKIESKTENFSHSENLNNFIVALMNTTAFTLKDLDAIAVSEGPGSYTGLRIGTSTAKGLCFGLNIPLIAINSLAALAQCANNNEVALFCPMFDAKRMEVYVALFDVDYKLVSPVEAKIIEADAFSEFLENKKVLFLGPGAEKCDGTIQHVNAIFDLETEVSATGMNKLSFDKFQNKDFVDVAYFEPFYLKDFIAGKPKKLL
ncbi:tRNA (adenosine(37)-N6)-threonylcarbamoyltransferase complex dimerization subunit type 1 TsaB [Putridiphycobacter roseus]|uniref:tRNA (Adenosine(37)-N6)-threonylcarbamoyltransferase complex dimerization subunit type 1 TsaB n=1 Tax=Putridiphycobacter roseus TaxID=2219161 RepID=A0A2W1NAU8_9FLAO|nr:tRNA (adenosine(37)-N6)-threonylcarbamoyltransferase complex dimerization subunit type 1 TsaB [Putridiphycobacter roseus]PZE16173.1 tRNA (adenosine(37)-N6)-threonylcarbamoyltransferase complex dimerization subunit type 1 TsaB [Putridiphycobacter roseus]